MPVFDPGVPWLRGTATLTNGSTTVTTDGVITLNEILEGDRLYVMDGGQRVGPLEIVGGEGDEIELREPFEGTSGSYSIVIDRNPITRTGAKVLRDVAQALASMSDYEYNREDVEQARDEAQTARDQAVAAAEATEGLEDKADEAIAAAGSAVTAADQAESARSNADAARQAAEAARDAAQLNARIYPTTAAGLAATTDGDYFSVLSEDSDDYLILYRNVSGSAVEVARYPSASWVRLLLLGRWIAPSAVRGDVYVTPLGSSGATVEWSGLHLMTGDGAARPVQDWPSTELPNNTALYIDTSQSFATEYEVTQAPLDHQLQESFVKGANYLLVAVRNGQVFGAVADIGHAAALQRDKLSVADANARMEYSFIRLVNVSGTGSALTGDIPAPLSDVPLTGYFGWRMPTDNADPMTITFAGETYSVKDMAGADIPAGHLPFGTDVIARMRGDGTVRLVGRYSNPDLTTLTAIQNAAASAPPTSEGEFLVFNPVTSTWVTMNVDEVTSPMKKLHDIDASGAAGPDPQTIVRSADAAQQITVANVAESGMIAIGLGGKVPVINGSGSLTLAPGAVLSLDYPPAGDVRVLSDVAGTSFTSRVKTARPYLSAAKASADALLSRYAGTLTARQRNAVRNLYAAFRPVLDQFLYLYVLASPAAPLSLLNWAGDNAATPVASPTFVAGQGYTFNGTTQHLMTGKVWAGSPFGAADRMMMAVSVDETINGATRAAISSGNSQIEANRSASSHGFRSATTSTDSITGSAAGGLIVAQRSDLDSFTVLRNGKEEGKLYREGVAHTMSYEHVIGAGTGFDGPTDETTHWAGTVQLAAAGNPLPEKEWSRINAAWVEYLAEIGA